MSRNIKDVFYEAIIEYYKIYTSHPPKIVGDIQITKFLWGLFHKEVMHIELHPDTEHLLYLRGKPNIS